VTTAPAETETTPTSIFAPELRSSSVAIVILITLLAFEAMAVSAALPTAARDVHGLGGYGWAFTGFLLASVVGMVVAGQVSDSRGPRVPLGAGLVCFAGGLVLSGTATTMEQLVAGRFVQGMGSGLIITSVYVVIGERFPRSLQPKVFAATSSAWVVPSLVGPVISGALTQHASWRLVFLGLLPFVAVGTLLLVPTLRALGHVRIEHHDARLADPRRIVRALCVAVGVAALEAVAQHPSALASIGAVVGLVLLGWGLHGLLPDGAVRLSPGVATPVVLRGLLSGAFFGVESTIPLAMSVQHHFGATEGGLPLACAGISWAAGSWWQGREVQRDEQRRRVVLLRCGFSLMLVAAVAVALAELPSTPGGLIYPAWALAGFGAGIAMSSTSVLLLRFTTDAERGANSAALQLSDSTGSAITTGVAGVLVAAATRGSLTYSTAFTIVGLTMAGIAVIGVVGASRARATGTDA